MSEGNRSAAPATKPVRLASGAQPAVALRHEEAAREAARLIEHLRGQLDELDRREANLNRQLISLDNERRAVRLAGQQAEQLAEQRDIGLSHREDAIAAREADLQTQSALIEQKQQQLGEQRAALEGEREQLRTRVLAEFTQEREELDAIRQKLVDREEALKQREIESRQQGIDLEKRTRFHEEHLAKLRREFSEQRAAFEQQKQRQRTWSLEVDESIRLRLGQMRTFRDLLDQREESLERESLLLGQQREAADRESARAAAAVAAQHEALTRETETRQAEFRSQQELIALHSSNLDGRRQRLDHLREELEQTHQSTLEMRVAVEQVYAEITQGVGTDEAETRIHAAQKEVLEHYRELRDALVSRRQELDETLRQAQARQDEFRTERDDYLRKLAEREDRLRKHDRQTADQSTEVANRETDLARLRDRWREDKLEAERVIRELIQQLESQAMGPEIGLTGLNAHSPVPLFPTDHIAA